jgi:hypothetical protein
MASYYDDNFGHWDDMDDPDMVDFYHQVQRESTYRECEGCGVKKKLRPGYICDSCATKREQGWDI